MEIKKNTWYNLIRIGVDSMKKKLYMLITILCMLLTLYPTSIFALAKKEVKLSLTLHI